MGGTSPVIPVARSAFLAEVERESGQRIMDCYQCGKCTAGCPAAFSADLTPRQIMRGVQLGLAEDVLDSSMIWLCVSCQTCTARCPCQIDIAGVMESLRLMATRENRARERDVALFHRLFLRSVEAGGRLWELGLGGFYNMSSGHPLANIGLLPALLARGKLEILPHRAKGAQVAVKRIFERAARLESKKP
ncbi:MAG: 4Fe-4S dicluster domain-containing protein [Dehalococcoidia bacterium]|nr:4Fe-4S dicluster domain-containing protein [Dehalococcoidia bacterium]